MVPEHCLLTYNPSSKRLYIHLMDYPGGKLVLKGYKGKVKYAQFLHDASEIKREENGDDLVLTLPEKQPGFTIPVLELML